MGKGRGTKCMLAGGKRYETQQTSGGGKALRRKIPAKKRSTKVRGVK